VRTVRWLLLQLLLLLPLLLLRLVRMRQMERERSWRCALWLGRGRGRSWRCGIQCSGFRRRCGGWGWSGCCWSCCR